MNKEELLPFVDLMLQSESYFKKIHLIMFLSKFIDYESEAENVNKDLDLRRKVQLRDRMIIDQGFSYFIKEGKTDNIYFAKYDTELEKILKKIDGEAVFVAHKFVEQNLDEEVDFGSG